MEVLYMLICSLLPAVLLIGYVRYRDRRRPEPMMRIIQAVIYGLFSAFLAVPLAMAIEGLVFSSGYGILPCCHLCEACLALSWERQYQRNR